MATFTITMQDTWKKLMFLSSGLVVGIFVWVAIYEGNGIESNTPESNHSPNHSTKNYQYNNDASNNKNNILSSNYGTQKIRNENIMYVNQNEKNYVPILWSK